MCDLQPMITAPRDGTFILGVDHDLSGASMMRFEEHDAQYQAEWMSSDGDPLCGADAEGEAYFAGWLPAPWVPVRYRLDFEATIKSRHDAMLRDEALRKATP